MVPSGPRVARTTVVVEFTDMSDNFSGRVTALGRLGAALENPEARARMEGAMRPLMKLLGSGNLGTSFDSEPGTVPYGRTCPLSGSVARKPAGPNGASETTVSLTHGAAVPTYPDSMWIQFCRVRSPRHLSVHETYSDVSVYLCMRRAFSAHVQRVFSACKCHCCTTNLRTRTQPSPSTTPGSAYFGFVWCP